MDVSAVAFSVLSSVAVAIGFVGTNSQNAPKLNQTPMIQVEEVESDTSKLVCKTGFKAGKTPASLVVGAKVSCVNIKQAAAGKKLLTSDHTNSCFACHSSIGIAPSSQMNSNLRTQGYSLKTASLLTAFNAHLDQMAGASVSTKDLKAISSYLQSIK